MHGVPFRKSGEAEANRDLATSGTITESIVLRITRIAASKSI
jgi:hypothetical protein